MIKDLRKIKPWHYDQIKNLDLSDEEVLDANKPGGLFEYFKLNIAASDLCFYVGKNSDTENVVYIVPNECLNYDNHIWIKEFDFLRKKFGFNLICEGAYEFNCKPTTIKKYLLKIGLIENEQFTKNCEGVAQEQIHECKDENCDENHDHKEHECSDSCEHEKPSKIQILNKKLNDLFYDMFVKPKDGETKENLYPKISKDEMQKYRIEKNSIIESDLNVKMDNVISSLSSFIKENVKELAESIEYVAEENDFSRFHDSQQDKENVLLEINEKDHWNVSAFSEVDGYIGMELKSSFINDGEDLVAKVFINDSGEITHSFIKKR